MSRWGDDLDDEEPASTSASQPTLTIPPTHTSRVDSKGIKLVTSYRAAQPSNPSSSSLLKTITKIKVQKVIVREHVAVSKRRSWKKFGQAALDEDQSNVTIQSRDDIYLEDPNADTDLQDEDVSKALAGNLNEFWEKQQRRALERKYGVDSAGPGAAAGGDGATANASAAEVASGWQKVGAEKAVGGKYVPPSQRGKAGAGGGSLAAMASRMPETGGKPADNRDQNTIRVSNISEDTTEADLQELFAPFGRISRVYLAKDKETMQSRGFAFVSFVHREDASRAMEKLQGYGYDHLILKLEWARPSAPKTSDPGTEGTQYRSGYGKALAQDTTQKVSFASNLTR
jgi:translation initiation factor 3 subunit G